MDCWNLTGIKKRYFNIVNNSDVENIHLWQVYLRIFTLLFVSFFPLTIMHFFIFINNDYDSFIKSTSLESIGFTLNIVFVVIYYTILFIALISSILKPNINSCSNIYERKKIVMSGLISILIVTLFLLTVFVIISIVYSTIRASSLENVSNSITHYMVMMIPIIVFNTISNFYVNISFSVNNMKSNWLLVSQLLFVIVETILIYVFCFYIKSDNFIVFLLIPSLVISFIKMILYTPLYYIRTKNYVFDFKNKENRFFAIPYSKDILKQIMNRCKMSIAFSISLVITIVIQSLFIKFAYSIDKSLGYLYTNNNAYVLLFVKIIDYNILYLVFIFSRSFNISILEHEDHREKSIDIKIKRRIFLRKINSFIITFLLIISVCVYFSIDSISENLFKDLSWWNETINDGDYFVGYKYSYVIPFLIKQSYLYGIISFVLVEESINNRVIIFRTDRADWKMFSLVIISYAISMSLSTYIFAFVLNHIFIGLSGFFIAFGLYGLLSLIVILVCEYFRGHKIYLEQLSKDERDKIKRLPFFTQKKWEIISEFRHNNKHDAIFYSIIWSIRIGIFSWIIYEICMLWY